MMTRGLADPLASAYCRLCIAHRAQKFPSCDTGYLITCVNDIKLIFTRISSTKETAHGSFADSTRSLVSLMEPSVEFIMKSILNDASPRRVDKVLIELELGRSQEELFRGLPCVSIVLHHLLKELATGIVCFHAVDILHLIKCSNDNSYDQYLNYRLVGLRLSEQISQIATVDAIVNEVIQVVYEYGLEEYLKVVDAYLDIVLQNQMDGHLRLFWNGSQSWHQIKNGFVHDPTSIQLLFEISQALHDDSDSVNMKNDDNQQQARLISRFVRMIMDNDLLFVGDSSYVRELLSLTESVLQNLVDVIEQEPSRAARGSMSLETCNSIASCFKINEHVLHVCSKLLETAKDKHLTSTIGFLDKNLHAAIVPLSITI